MNNYYCPFANLEDLAVETWIYIENFYLFQEANFKQLFYLCDDHFFLNHCCLPLQSRLVISHVLFYDQQEMLSKLGHLQNQVSGYPQFLFRFSFLI